jgi:hypothetical protein
LSLALLIAQLGMQAHAYSHLASEKHGVPSTLQTCGHCVSVAPLLTAVGSSQYIWLAHRPATGYVAATETTSIAFLLPCPAFRSRAPPALL